MAARDVIRGPLRRRLRAASPAHVQEQGQERPGSARVHPADRHGRERPSTLRLEPDQRKLYDLIWKRSIASQMEAARFERTTVEIASADGRGRPARHRPGRDLRRLPQGLPRGPRRRGDRARRATRTTAACRTIVNGERGREARGDARAALHPAAAALHRGDAGQAPGGARHRPPLHLRLDRLDDPGARVRPQGEEPARSPRTRAGWSPRSWRTTSAATSTTTSPPTSRRTSTGSPPARRTGRRCWRASGATSPPRSARPRACASPRCWRRSTRCWSRTSSR